MRYRALILCLLSVCVLSIVWICWAVIGTALRVKGVGGWVATACVIDSVAFQPDDADEPKRCFWDIRYKYRYDGQTYVCGRYNVLEFRRKATQKERTDFARASGREVTGPYSTGEMTVCFVNAAEPSEAVLDRRWTVRMVMVPGPLVGVFYIVAAGSGIGLIAVLRERRD